MDENSRIFRFRVFMKVRSKKKNEIDSLRVNLDVDGAQFEQLYQNFYTDILSLQPFFFETDCVKIKIYKVNCEKSLQTFDRSEGIKLMHN